MILIPIFFVVYPDPDQISDSNLDQLNLSFDGNG